MLKFSNNFRERQYNRYKAEGEFSHPNRNYKDLGGSVQKMNRKIKDRAFRFTKENWGSLLVAMLPIIIIAIISNLSVRYVGTGSIDGSTVTTSTSYSTNYGNFLSAIGAIFAVNLAQVVIPLANKHNWGKINPNSEDDKLTILSSFKNLGETFFPILFTTIAMQASVFLLAAFIGVFVAVSFFYPIAIFLIFVLLFLFIWVLIRLSMAEYIVVDMVTDLTGVYSQYKNKNLFYRAVSALKESWNLTRGKSAEIIILGLSLIGWVFLLLVTLGLALFFIQPYFLMVQYSLYQELIAEAYPNQTKLP